MRSGKGGEMTPGLYADAMLLGRREERRNNKEGGFENFR